MIHFLINLIFIPITAVKSGLSWAYGNSTDQNGAPLPQGARELGKNRHKQYLAGGVLALLYGGFLTLPPVINQVKVMAGNIAAVETLKTVKQEYTATDSNTLIVSSKGEGKAYIMAKSALNQWMQKTGNPWTHHPSYTRYGIASSLKKLDNWLGTGSGAEVQDIPEAIPYDIDTMQTLIVSVDTDLGQGVCLNKQMQKVQCDQIHRDNLKNIANYEQFKTQTESTAKPKQTGAVVEPLPDLPELGLLGMKRGKVKPVLNPFNVPPAKDWALMGNKQKATSPASKATTGLTPEQAREKLTTAKLYGVGAVLLALLFLFVLKNTESTLIITPIFFAGFLCAIFAVGDYREWQGSPEYLSGADVLAYTAAQEQTTATIATVAPAWEFSGYKMDAIRFLLFVAGLALCLAGLVALPKYGLVFGYIPYQVGFLGLAVLAGYWFSFPLSGEKIKVLNAGAMLAVIPLFGLFFLPTAGMQFVEAWKETTLYRDWFLGHKGQNNARWGSILSYWQHDYTSWFDKAKDGIKRTTYSPLIVGKTLTIQDTALGSRYIGTTNEQHLLTVSLTGGGKTRDSIAMNTLTYCGGMLLFDTKAEHVTNSWKERKAYAPAYIIDPYRMNKEGLKTDFWNPLDRKNLDPEDNRTRDRIQRMCEAIIEMPPAARGSDEHFVENPRLLLAGFIAHVITEAPEDKRSLPAVFDLFIYGAGVAEEKDSTKPDLKKLDAVFAGMAKNSACNGLAMEAASHYFEMNEKSKAEHFSTITRSMQWVKNVEIEENLKQKSSFSFADLKEKDATVYLIIPEHALNIQKRYLRVFYQSAFDMLHEHQTPQPEGSKRRVLFLFDEFKAFGVFQYAEDAVLRLRSSFVKCWFILQNAEQLEAYNNVQNFFGNCDLQVFGVSATDTVFLEKLKAALGEYTVESRGENGLVEKTPLPLLSPENLQEILKGTGGKQIFITVAGNVKLLLARFPYYSVWKDKKHR